MKYKIYNIYIHVVMVTLKFPQIRLSRYFCCFSNSSLNISFISIFNCSYEIIYSPLYTKYIPLVCTFRLMH